MSDSILPMAHHLEDRDFDPAEVFAAVLRHVRDNDVTLQRLDMSDWRGEDPTAATTHLLARTIMKSGVITERQFVDAMSHPYQAFSLLRAIDLAFATVDPYDHVHDRGWFGRYRQNLMTLKRYNADAGDGYVLPRRCFPTRPQPVPDHVSEYFQSLMLVERVPDHLHFAAIESDLDFKNRIRSEATIEVGCVPFLDHFGELEIRRVERADAWYSIQAKDDDDWAGHWHERCTEALANLDQSGVHIGMLPELALTDEILRSWKRILQDTPRPRTSRLEWVLVGTGPLTADPAFDQQPNRAVLLHRRTGKTIMWQDKCEPFTLTDAQVDAWQLTAQLSDGPLAEWMRDSKERYVLDTRMGRIAILVCEDLSRMLPVGAELALLGPTHLFIPIFAPPIIRHRWQEQSALQFANTVGSVSVVANSQVVKPVGGDESCTALAILPTGRGPTGTWSADTHTGNTKGDPAGVVPFTLPRS
jgi:hypothetical protein